MGCGSSNSASVVEDRPIEEGQNDALPDDEKMESIANTPDHYSEQIDPPTIPQTQEVPRLESPAHVNGEVINSTLDDIEDSPMSAGNCSLQIIRHI